MEHTEKVAEQEMGNQPEDADVRAVGPASGASHRSDRTLYEILDHFSSNVPDEEWAKLPPDLSFNLDHYIYGTPKRTPPGEC